MVKSNKLTKTIAVTPEVHTVIDDMRRKDETMNNVIKRLIESYLDEPLESAFTTAQKSKTILT